MYYIVYFKVFLSITKCISTLLYFILTSVFMIFKYTIYSTLIMLNSCLLTVFLDSAVLNKHVKIKMILFYTPFHLCIN